MAADGDDPTFARASSKHINLHGLRKDQCFELVRAFVYVYVRLRVRSFTFMFVLRSYTFKFVCVYLRSRLRSCRPAFVSATDIA